MFDYLFERRAKLELAFGSPLEWRRIEDKQVSIVCFAKEFDGIKKENWPKMIDWLVAHIKKLNAAFDPEINNLRQLLKTRFPKGNA